MFYDLWIPVIRACDLRGLLLSLVEREVMNFQLQWKKDFFSCKLRQFKYADDNFKNCDSIVLLWEHWHIVLKQQHGEMV